MKVPFRFVIYTTFELSKLFLVGYVTECVLCIKFIEWEFSVSLKV